MQKDNHLLQYEDVCSLTINDLLNEINQKDGVKLNQLKVMDLTYHNKEPIYPGIGVYIFRNDKDILLVGKVSSMSFTERIAKHFDLRKGAWFNTLVKPVSYTHLTLPTTSRV